MWPAKTITDLPLGTKRQEPIYLILKSAARSPTQANERERERERCS